MKGKRKKKGGGGRRESSTTVGLGKYGGISWKAKKYRKKEKLGGGAVSGKFFQPHVLF